MGVGNWLTAISIGTQLAQASQIQQVPILKHGHSEDLSQARKDTRSNIIFIITDDQDLLLDSMSYMPKTNKHIKNQGAVYTNHFVTTAVCCPSRVALWTGRQPHNTNVTDVNPPYGGYPKFISQGFNDNFLPVWLQEGGYDTYYTGKLFNAHGAENYNKPFVKGFTGSDISMDPNTYQYLQPVFQRNRDSPVDYTGRHVLDVLQEKAYGFLEDGLAGDVPFFLGVAPVAPHSNIDILRHGVINETSAFRFTAPIPLERHQHLFEDVKVPRSESFNPETPSGASWIKQLPEQNQTNIEYNDHFYRQRLRALQGVDELVEGIVERLEKADALENTYIFYTSDHGFHIGQHRLQPGKCTGYDEDIRVPFLLRGPGIPKGSEVSSVTTHIDLAPTLMKIAGLSHRDDFDGIAIPLNENEFEVAEDSRHEHVTVEYWGMAAGEGKYGAALDGSPGIIRNNTYKALRIVSKEYSLYYSVWCTNEHELYDLRKDPHELHNLYAAASSAGPEQQLLGVPISKLIARLDALTMVLKSCKGSVCVKPWNELHPEGDVRTLKEALAPKFDHFYTAQAKVEYNWCADGYILEAEGPQDVYAYRAGVDWSHWT